MATFQSKESCVTCLSQVKSFVLIFVMYLLPWLLVVFIRVIFVYALEKRVLFHVLASVRFVLTMAINKCYFTKLPSLCVRDRERDRERESYENEKGKGERNKIENQGSF